MPFKLPLPPHPQKARKAYPEVVAAVVAVFELPLPAAVEVAAAETDTPGKSIS
jgi:cell division septation protein DedD